MLYSDYYLFSSGYKFTIKCLDQLSSFTCVILQIDSSYLPSFSPSQLNYSLIFLLKMSPFNHRYEKNWDKPNKTKLLQGAMERAGRLDLAERLHCLHWGHQKLSQRVELPSAFPFLITVHKTMRNQDALHKINDLNHKHLWVVFFQMKNCCCSMLLLIVKQGVT